MLVGWDVTGIKVTGNVQEATASYNSLLDTCPKCGSVDRLYRHGVKAVDYRDAPAFGKQFVIRCQVQRWRCRECNETSMQHGKLCLYRQQCRSLLGAWRDYCRDKGLM
jgi:transposase